MQFTTFDYIVVGAGVFLTLLWIFLFFYGQRYASLFDDLDDSDYKLSEIFITGYALMELIKYDYRSKADRETRNYLTILYDLKYTEFYLRLSYAQGVSYGLLALVLAMPLYALTGEKFILVFCLMLAFLSVYYFLTLARNKIKKRSEEIMSDFAEVVSKLALLTNAGMVLTEAWELVANTKNSIIYNEMQKSVVQMRNGLSETEAIRSFGVRCVIPEVKKFASTIIQGLLKGNAELVAMLIQQSDEVWTTKKQMAKTQGELANNKLIIPTMIIFVGILIMIIIPIFANLGGV